MHTDTYTLEDGSTVTFTYPPATQVSKQERDRFSQWIKLVTGKLIGDTSDEATVRKVEHEPATSDQFESIMELSAKKRIPLDVLCDRYNILSLDEISSTVADQIIDVLNEVEHAEKDTKRDPVEADQQQPDTEQ